MTAPAPLATPLDAPASTLARSVGEAGSILRLAYPVAIAQVGLLAMGLVDMYFVGQLGPIELAAAALGDALFFAVFCAAMGTLQALDPLVSQAHGARDPARCAAAWRAGVRWAYLLTLPVVLALWGVGPLLRLGSARGALNPVVVDLTAQYVLTRAFGVLPWLLYGCDRSLLQGLGHTRPAMVITLGANVANAVLVWALVFGRLGLPALGLVGSGLATAACSWLMYAGMATWARRLAGDHRGGAGVSRELLVLVLTLGAPIGLAMGLEVGAFTAASLLMANLGVVALASHQVAIKLASTTFMLAVAIGVATGVRVGNATGARRPAEAALAGWTGIALGALVMGTAALMVLALRVELVSLFTADLDVIATGASLCLIVAAFQVSDGTQAVAGGALRGLGDTRWPAMANLVAHWGVGLPLGWWLAFELGHGPEGLWWALAAGLTAVAGLLVWRFRAMQGAAPIDLA